MGFPERQGFTLKRAEGSLHGEGRLQDVQTALCTSAIRSGVNLYTYIGPMVRRCSKWQVLVMVPFRSSADLRFGMLESRSRRGWGGRFTSSPPPSAVGVVTVGPPNPRKGSGRFLDPFVHAELATTAWEFV